MCHLRVCVCLLCSYAPYCAHIHTHNRSVKSGQLTARKRAWRMKIIFLSAFLFFCISSKLEYSNSRPGILLCGLELAADVGKINSLWFYLWARRNLSTIQSHTLQKRQQQRKILQIAFYVQLLCVEARFQPSYARSGFMFFKVVIGICCFVVFRPTCRCLRFAVSVTETHELFSSRCACGFVCFDV